MGIKGGFFNSHGSTADPRYDPAFPVIGPYVITIGPQQTTTALLYERNPYYWKVDTAGNQLPYIDFQEYTLYEDQDAVALAAANGQIDMEWRHLNAPKFRPLIVENRDRGDYRIIPTDFTYANEIAIKLNLTHPDPVKREVFQNKNFRIGLSHAIDRQAIIDTVYSGVGEVANISPLRSSGLYTDEMAKQYTEYNVDLANRHLDEAGYAERDGSGIRLGPDGKPIRIAFEVIAGFVDPGELIANNWRAVGIDAQFSEIERSLHMTQIFANEHDVVLWSGDGGTRGDLFLNPRIYLPTSPFESEHATPLGAVVRQPGRAGGDGAAGVGAAAVPALRRLQRCLDAGGAGTADAGDPGDHRRRLPRHRHHVPDSHHHHRQEQLPQPAGAADSELVLPQRLAGRRRAVLLRLRSRRGTEV